MYGCESWTIKKAEHQIINAFELSCWRRLLRVHWMQGDPISPSWRKSVLGVHWKDWCWSWNFNTLATWYEELTHWKRLWFWERLMVGGEGHDRGWDGWKATPSQWTRVWVGSRSWWWTGKPGVLQFMGSQRVGYDWATELNWTGVRWYLIVVLTFIFLMLSDTEHHSCTCWPCVCCLCFSLHWGLALCYLLWRERCKKLTQTLSSKSLQIRRPDEETGRDSRGSTAQPLRTWRSLEPDCPSLNLVLPLISDIVKVTHLCVQFSFL